MVTSKPATTTITASVSEAHEHPTTLRSSSRQGCQRIYRCRRCSQRKFRTSRDLATHILAKHSHIHLIPTTTTSITRLQTKASASLSSALGDDAKSVTLTSPLITAADMGEIDRLLAAVSKSRSSTAKPHNLQSSLDIRRPRVSRAHVNTDIVTHTISSSRSYVDVCTTKVQATQERKSAQAFRASGKKPESNECTGPSSHEVFISRCRRGLIPVVPVQSQPSEKLNFAQGLF